MKVKTGSEKCFNMGNKAHEFSLLPSFLRIFEHMLCALCSNRRVSTATNEVDTVPALICNNRGTNLV